MTKLQWLELTGKQQWDVMVALRGPDCQCSEGIKWITTAVLRWAMHSIIRVGGTLNEDLRGVIVPYDTWGLDKTIRTAQGGDKVLSWSSHHFFQHVKEAAGILSIPQYVVPNDVYFEAVRDGLTSITILRLWHWTKGREEQEGLRAELARHTYRMTGRDADVLWIHHNLSTTKGEQNAASGE